MNFFFLWKQYKAKVQENQENVLVTRIPVEDKDLVNTPNWRALFEVTKGNESGNFRMETDPKTNEGLLYVIKVNGFKDIKIIVCTGSYFVEASENNLFGK